MNSREICKHRAPLRGRRLSAQPEEAEASGLEDRVGDAERGLDDERGEAIGQDGDEHQPQRPDADDASRGHVILMQFAHRRGAHQTHVARQIDDGHRDDGVGETGAENRDDENGEHQARHRHDQVHGAGDDDVERGARHRGGKPQHDADDEGDAHDGNADEQRNARAKNQARQHVVAIAVGAEHKTPSSPFPPYGLGAHRLAELLDGRMRRKEIGEDRDQRDRRNDAEPDHRAAILAKSGPKRGDRRRLRQHPPAFVDAGDVADLSGHGGFWG